MECGMQRPVERAATWHAANPEKVAVYKLLNAERITTRKASYRAAKPEKGSGMSARRRARKLNATPAWADPVAIAAIYAESARLTKMTGVQYNVDHIIPLQGKLVSGLHVENNLQILTCWDNGTKNNKYEVAT
jgi:hypothetical protein